MKLIYTFLAIMFSGLHCLGESKPKPVGFVLRALPGMKVITKRGKRNFYVPPVKGVDGIVAFAEWDHLQPTADGKIRENNVIDQAISAVQTWNKSHPDEPIFIRLRTFSGIYSPDWLMKSVGSVSVDYRKKLVNKPMLRQTPKFWTADYLQKWKNFQLKLADKYDKCPLIRDISVSACMTLHSEVMWRQFAHPYVMKSLVEAGLTRDKDLWAQKQQITIALQTWKTTPIEMTFNSRRNFITANNELKFTGPDAEMGEQLLNFIRTETLKQRKGEAQYMIGNHSLSKYSVLENSKQNSPKHILYQLKEDHKKHGSPLYFQTEVFTSDVVEKLLLKAIEMGASLVELPNDITPEQIQSPELQRLRNLLKQKQK